MSESDTERPDGVGHPHPVKDENGPEDRVRRLPDALIDQIAAGEVVERPASVVKELVENALDAGARRVRVDVRDGGKALIAVTDDGCGMSPRDARVALERHATSKLSQLSDLEAVGSFGFRGEALPAIASVSRMRLTTRPADDDEGTRIEIDSGERIGEGAAGGPPGTRIEVADLFARVPARRKFLKSHGTEWGHIIDWLRRLAIALPGIHFEVRRDDRAPLVWPAVEDPLDRIAAVLGEDEASRLVAVQAEDPRGHLEAWVSTPEATRANANGLYLYVNGRPVRDKVMRHAVLQAYRDLIPKGRFPSAVVFLTFHGPGVDVNVHPAKWEVRFADSQAVHQLIRRAVRDAMGNRGWLANGEPATAVASSAGASSREASGMAPTTSRVDHTGGAGRATDTVRDRGASDWVLAEPPSPPTAKDAAPAALPGLDAPATAPRTTALQFGQLRLIGQLLASYLLVEGKEGLLLIDQHAAHERVLYERLRAQWFEAGVDRQGLLIATPVELDPLEAAALEANAETALRLGFEIESFGQGSVMVRAIPALLAGRDPTPLVRELASELANAPVGADAGTDTAEASDSDTRLLAAVDHAFATLACHSARRAGDHLDAKEQQQILNDLDTIPWAPTCPHGRPVAVSYGLDEIERRFSRR
ncbi:MAG: DNA mismatch repair endonuclease MutL [Myxococcota bacterium]|nr:DNA mismatch repair endonuclease MutL [Myxococcota bacterium]